MSERAEIRADKATRKATLAALAAAEAVYGPYLGKDAEGLPWQEMLRRLETLRKATEKARAVLEKTG